jgi:bacterioferritin
MPREEIESGLNVTRERIIQLLNDNLEGEHQAMIAYILYSQVLEGAAYTDIMRDLESYAAEELGPAKVIAKQIDHLGGMPSEKPKSVRTSNEQVEMLRAAFENERETVWRYRERIHQAEAMEEFPWKETSGAITVQEKENRIHLSDALGMNVPLTSAVSA